MTVQQVAQAHYLTQRSLQAATLVQVLADWNHLDPTDVTGSWLAGIGTQIYVRVSSAQLLAASIADRYVDNALRAQNLNPDPAAGIAPRAFAGTASDGRSLESLLFEAIITVRAGFGAGLTAPDALARGQRALTSYVQTQVADAGRTAVGAAIVARPTINGWVRMLTVPSCARCTVLAGKWYQWNQGFRRHPFCDCRHIPAAEATSGDLRVDARAAIAAGRVTGLSKADTHAIVEDGADVGQVINAHRGMYAAPAFGRSLQATREGTTARGATGRALGATTPRLRPEEIYRQAGDDRTEALRLLRRFGYLT